MFIAHRRYSRPKHPEKFDWSVEPEWASGLPAATRLATTPPTQLDHELNDLPTTTGLSQREEYFRGWPPVGGRMWLLFAATNAWQITSSEGDYNGPIPSDVLGNGVEGRHFDVQWPQLLPTDIFRVELADLMHDTLSLTGNSDLDWDHARQIAAIMTAAWNLSDTHAAAASIIGVPSDCADAADKVIAAAAQLGTMERLEKAVSFAAQATGRWRHFMTAHTPVIREIASWLNVPDSHYADWRRQEYLCQLEPALDDRIAAGM